MSLKKLEKTLSLTAEDEELIGKIAYAMVVTGVWQRAVRRSEPAFDFYEICRAGGLPAYRIGRTPDGVYVLFNLATGVRKYGSTMAETLRDIAYVPSTR